MMKIISLLLLSIGLAFTLYSTEPVAAGGALLDTGLGTCSLAMDGVSETVRLLGAGVETTLDAPFWLL